MNPKSAGISALALSFFLSGCVIDRLGGNFAHEPENAAQEMSGPAQAMVQAAFADIAPGALRDYHTHLLSLGTSTEETFRNDGFVNPRLLSWLHPIHRIKTSVYMSAAQVHDLDQGDQQFLERLVRLIRAMPAHGRHQILGFDRYYGSDGKPVDEKSEFYTPNEYVWAVSQRYPDLFVPVISVHPYRVDALAELAKWGERGVKFIKWLPNAQGIDASDPRLDPYYALVRQHGMTILTHVGEEQAVEAEEDQRLGNPLLFRRPLDQGVRIIMAHCASLGTDVDLDDPQGRRVPSFDLFLRLMNEPKYEGLLYGDLSATVQFNRLPGPLSQLLAHPELHGRLVNGSDYPLPAVNAIIDLDKLVKHGLLDEADLPALREIYSFNPLLFDYVLKRRLHSRDGKHRLSPGVFTRVIG